MGDRALVIFTDGAEVSPVVYLHWNATAIPAWLEEWKTLMKDRMGDVSYGCARFIGIAHTDIHGALSLGTWNTDDALAAAILSYIDDGSQGAIIANESHGEGGVVIVDVRTGNWHTFGGHLTKEDGSFVTHWSGEEAKRLSRLLKNYFPEIGTEESMTGSEVIDELSKLYDALENAD